MTVIVDAAEQVNPLDNLRDPRWRGRRLLGRQQLWAGVAAAVVCWGWNDYGQADAPPLGRFTALAAGNAHTCAIRVDKTIACWGVSAWPTAVSGSTSAAMGGGGLGDGAEGCGWVLWGVVGCGRGDHDGAGADGA